MKKIPLILLVTATLLLLCGWLEREQTALADKVVRLHVLANSDSEADQTLKLQVRDSLLQRMEENVQLCDGVDGAKEEIVANLEEFTSCAQAVIDGAGYPYSVTVELTDDVWFPTKEYADFSLPCGYYTALRVVIGQGAGENWWCVLFPPLCLDSVTETVAEVAELGGLTAQEVALMTGESGGYLVKFRAIEWWEELTR